jgi:hypothetical protein
MNTPRTIRVDTKKYEAAHGRKPAPCPNIDLGAHFKIIEERDGKMMWKTIATNYATEKHAQAVIRAHNLPGVWMCDFTGDKQYIART